MKESDILKQILDYLTAKRVFAFRLGTGAFFFEARAFRSHSLGPGAADILALPEQLPPTWIECKNERGRQSDHQRSFQSFVEAAGHRYVVARSIDDLQGVL